MRTLLVLATVILAAAAVSLPKATQCPDIADAHVATAWQEYRAGRFERAEKAFSSALVRCPSHLDSQVGLGYVALQNMAFDSARGLFHRVLSRMPTHVEAVIGLGLTQWRTEQYDSARTSFARALRLDPRRDDVAGYLARLPAPLGSPPKRPPLVLPDTVVYYARVAGDAFQTRTPAGWQVFYVNGVNLGAALPGKFPSEFPDSGTYQVWLREIAAMGANTVRVYTLHPPEFYTALAAYNNQHPQKPIWLLHGVWAELPPNDDYYDPQWRADFYSELERAVDVLHGRADVKQRAGHAAGYYTADVSRWTLGFIIGREWEPASVAAFNEHYALTDDWRGQFLSIGHSSPMDVWLTRALDHLVAYETRRYHMQRPVAYTNWPTLDPLEHSTELNVAQELTIRGQKFNPRLRNHNEDEVSAGGVAPQSSATFHAGYFAAFHAYPYYPDFLLHDKGYNSAVSPWGKSTYFGYLTDLKRALPNVPILIAEYGVPASWGIAHFNPQGWHHGGHSEVAMAQIDARLAREIAAAGMAGGVLFSWIDEWFKHSWLAAPLEQPAVRNRMWQNRMDPEQHYGVLAMEPLPRLGETLQQRSSSWDTIRPLYALPDGTRIRAHADEAYLWLQVSGRARSAPELVIGFDITDAASGAMSFPGAAAPASPVGLEFALCVSGDTARILTTPQTNPFQLRSIARGATKGDHWTPVAHRPPGYFVGNYTQVLNDGSEPVANATRFEPFYILINRARVDRDSINLVAMGYDWGVLRRGALPDGAWEAAPQADALEFRIPWNLIGITDPSSRTAISALRRPSAGEGLNTERVDAIRIVAAARDTRGSWRVFPSSGRRADVAEFSWPTWEAPQFRVRRRPVFDAMRSVYRELELQHSMQASKP